jgi:hypothetical protein
MAAPAYMGAHRDACPRAETSTFMEATKYAVPALGATIVGATLTALATATLFKVAGIALTILGGYSFMAILICGLANAGNPLSFKRKLPRFVGAIVSQAVVEISIQIARIALLNLIFGDRRR